MDINKPMEPPYPKEDNRPYPPPYTEHPTDAANFSQPLGGQGAPYPPYPTDATYPVPESSNIPHIYPPYPPTSVPVTTPPSGVTTIQVVEAPVQFGSESQYVRCPNCGMQGFTVTESKPSTTTHIIALILCCVILWPIAWIPYVCSSCQNTVHHCPNCNHFLGERTV